MDSNHPSHHPPYKWATVAGLGVFALYCLTLAPTTAFWDASEYIATADIVGIPHPPGNPLFVILGKVWTVLLAPFGFSVAVRVNLLSAAMSAAAAGFYFLIGHRILRPLFEDKRLPLVGAGVAVLISATAFTVWNQSTVNEKVYTVSMMVMALATWLAIVWYDRREEPGSLKYLLMAGYILLLGSTNHLMSLLPGPALVLLVLLADPGVLIRKSFLSRAVPLAVIALSVNFFLPIRAAQNPVINEGEPTCESVGGAAVAVYTNGRAGCEALADNLTRAQYGERDLSERDAPFRDQFENYWQYFDWQWARGLDPAPQPSKSRGLVSILFLFFGLLGLTVIWRSSRELFYYFASLTAVVTVGLVYYLDFRYGYSLAPHITDILAHEVRERDYFFLLGFGLWGVLAGLGLVGLWGTIADKLSGANRHLAAAPILLFAFIPLVFNWSWASRAGDYAARDWAYNLLMSVEPYGVLFTNGDNDTFPLWYLQEVEGIRQDVTVVVGQYLYTPWYPKQLQALTALDRQRPFRQEDTAGVYEIPESIPDSSIISASHEMMDQIRLFQRLSEDLTVPIGEVAVTYPQGMGLDRGDQLALRIIMDSIGQRPVYFAGTTDLMDRLALNRWGVRHGLALKLVGRDPAENPDPSWQQVSVGLGGEWVDVDRSVKLLRDVYLYRGLDGREIWPDLASSGIPFNIAAAHYMVAEAGDLLGRDPDEMLELWERGDRLMVTARGGSSVFRLPEATP